MNNPQTFWNWFLSAHHRLLVLRGPRDEVLMDEILEQLLRYSPGLWFEIGGDPDGPMELVISAHGDPDYFDAVRTLVNAAPHVPGWQFIAFKPAQGFTFKTEYKNVLVDPASSWFLPLVSESRPDAFGIRVAVPGFNEQQAKTYLNAVYIVLDTGLGELQAAESIQHVEVVALPDQPEDEGYIELNELGDYLAWRARNSA